MKKGLSSVVAVVLCMGILAGCTAKSDITPNKNITTQETDTENPGTSTNAPNYTAAYDNLISFKVDDYESQSVVAFNRSLTPANDDISEILENYAEVTGGVLEDDENYDFIHVTLDASLNELYCEQLNDEISFFRYVKKFAQPYEPLNEEEKQILNDETLYNFLFSAIITVHYTIKDPSLTIGERDDALRTFFQDLQTYVDDLSESKIMASNIGDKLTKKAVEIADSLSSKKFELTCEISNIEISNNGIEIQY